MPVETPVGRNGWRQGSILRQNDHAELDEGVRTSLRVDARLLIVSHDCDVTSDSYEKEPRVELLIAYPVSEIKGGRKFGKNPRELEFAIRMGGTSLEYIACVFDRFSVDRKLLEDITPDPQANLSADNIALLRSWLALRYSRSAFPDEFENRLRPIKRKIDDILDKKGHDISAIFVAIEPHGEASADEPYKVLIYAAMPVTLYSQANRRTNVQTVVNELGRLFGNCKGIELVDAELRSESDISLDDMRFLKRFTNEYLSHNKPQNAEFLPDPNL